MTRLERFKVRLMQDTSIMIMRPLHPLSINRILVQAALLLGISVEHEHGHHRRGR